MSLPRVLVLSFTDLARDPRVNRQIRFLHPKFRVIAAGTAPPEIAGVEFVGLAPRRKGLAGRLVGAVRLAGRGYEGYYWNTANVTDCLERLAAVEADVVLANDVETLPAALELAGKAPVVFDAHEYAPLEFEDQLTFRLLHRPYRSYLCRTYIPRCRGMMTVCERIAEEYARTTGVRPVVVWNAPDYAELVPAPTTERIRLVHHGGAQRSRKIELMIRMMKHLDERFELSLVLLTRDEEYLRRLRAEAGGDPRIRFLDPVPMRELPEFLNRFDVGVFLLPPVNFNYRYALPNKLFEFVQARLAVAIGPSPEMARLSGRYGFGLVAPEFSPESLARCLSELTADRLQELKERSHVAARELSAERARKQVLELVNSAAGVG